MAGSTLVSPLRMAVLSGAMIALLGACSPDRDAAGAAGTGETADAVATPPAPADGATGAAPAVDPAGEAGRTCNADGLQNLVGQEASETVVAQATADSGATNVRVLGPDDVATMDFRNDRLTITTDARRIIQTINCG